MTTAQQIMALFRNVQRLYVHPSNNAHPLYHTAYTTSETLSNLKSQKEIQSISMTYSDGSRLTYTRHQRKHDVWYQLEAT